MVVFAAHIVGNISIHAPRGGSDNRARDMYISSLTFQSTLPVGGATRSGRRGRPGNGDFNPRSPWGERLAKGGKLVEAKYFNPRSPWGERPSIIDEGGNLNDFNPRSPWGERQHGVNAHDQGDQFQSTLPVGGAT